MRLSVLKYRKNLTTLKVIKDIRLRTGFFKIYESVDRLDMLEMDNRQIKNNFRSLKQDTESYKNTIDLLTQKV